MTLSPSRATSSLVRAGRPGGDLPHSPAAGATHSRPEAGFALAGRCVCPPVMAEAAGVSPKRFGSDHGLRLASARTGTTDDLAEVLPVLTTNSPGAAAPGLFGGGICVTLPWPPKALSPNGRANWKVKARAAKGYRKTCADAAWNAGLSPMETFTLASLTICPPDKRKRDEDNIRAAFKAGQDGLADALGADDADFRPVILWSEVRPGGAIIAHFVPIPIPG